MMKKRQIKLNVAFIACSVWLAACDNGIVGTGFKPTDTGFAQKGPFQAGSAVTIVSYPPPDYAAGTTYQLQTLDDIGRFEFTFKLNTLYDIDISGLHFNEVSGEVSQEPLTLKSTYYHDLDGKPFVGVNILTHLIHLRVKHLLDEDRKLAPADRIGPAAIEKQSRVELQAALKNVIFAKHLNDVSFSDMAVYDLENTDTRANAVLLFISSAFYQLANSVQGGATMAEMMTTIAEDLAADGLIDDVFELENAATSGAVIVSSLDDAAHQLNPDTIRNNLTLYSIEKTGAAIPVPDIGFLLDNDGDDITNNIDSDNDGDGIPDIQDPHPYQFEIFLKPQTLTTTPGTGIQIALEFNSPENPGKNPVYPSKITAPSNGTLEKSALMYTPNAGFTGEDKISVTVTCTLCPATGYRPYESNEAVITINVQAQ